jgi:predicted anti-sigma-YlaC factor YlaD
MPVTTAHPERLLLHEFAAARLSGDDQAVVERHLGRCAACRALVNSIPPPAPSPDAAVAAADEDEGEGVSFALPIALAPLERTTQLPTVARRMTPVRAAGRTRRIVAAALAVLIIILLAASAWYVTTDDFRDRTDASSPTTASSSYSSTPTQQIAYRTSI